MSDFITPLIHLPNPPFQPTLLPLHPPNRPSQSTNSPFQPPLSFQAQLEKITQQLASTFVPEFLLSTDFRAYYESTPEATAVGCLDMTRSDWLPRVQAVLQDYPFPIMLFPQVIPKSVDGAPAAPAHWANAQMRGLFGPVCDKKKTTLRDFVHPSSAKAEIRELKEAMADSEDCLTHITFRTQSEVKMYALVYMKMLRAVSQPVPSEVLYSLLVLADTAVPDATEDLKKLNFVVRAIP